MAKTSNEALSASRPATGRISGAGGTLGNLRVIAGGRNKPAMVTVERRAWDELHMELAVLEDEALQLVAELLPIARRLEFYATHDGSVGAWNLAAALADKLIRYGRRFQPGPRAA